MAAMATTRGLGRRNTVREKIMTHASEVKNLSGEALEALLNREVIALVIRAFCGKQVTAKLSAWFEKHPSRANYRWSDTRGVLRNSDTDRVGVPLNELYPILFSAEAKNCAVRDALRNFGASAYAHTLSIRELCRPYIMPIDELRLQLDEAWPFGAHIANFGGIRPHVGVARLVSADVERPCEAEPHLDWLPPEVKSFEEQFSGIVYLDVPDTGGELELWDIDRSSMINLIRDRDALKRCDLPAPVVIRPQCGDLILINTRYPHAIRGFPSGRRIVQTCFVGVDANAPLWLWS